MINRKEYHKQWYIKNKEKLNKQGKEWKEKNPDRIKAYSKYYYNKNKIRINENVKKWRKNNPEKAKENNINSKKNRRKDWEGYIPKITNCQICNKKIFFNEVYAKNFNNSIFFDHRNEDNEPIKSPSTWLGSNKRTVESQKLWESCKFGMLCNNCNGFLPTKNRKEFLRKVIKYVFGDNATIVLE